MAGGAKLQHTAVQGTFQEELTMFLCNDGAGFTGQFVYIRDDRETEEYFSLCEVQVFGPAGQ